MHDRASFDSCFMKTCVLLVQCGNKNGCHRHALHVICSLDDVYADIHSARVPLDAALLSSQMAVKRLAILLVSVMNPGFEKTVFCSCQLFPMLCAIV